MKFKAFTLAEVLITLTIIGIIAAMTIPALMHKYEEQITVTKVKEANSILANAFAMARIKNGDYPSFLAEQSDLGKTGSEATIEYLKDSLKISKDCGTTPQNCRPER